ncbi:translocation/assembly module TamB domain-containing protein [Deinococcus sp. VB142]|uniref:Translocation/assembly module TamB domain-containing protein n=1 Tax=Deinococcus sp. VB142 TaxID=3112952 RepID=A0AAU6Q3X5_9DEIO
MNRVRAPRRARRWPWLLLGGGLLLGTLVYTPLLFGGALLRHYGEQIGLSAEQVSGPLWSPKLSRAALAQPGIKLKAGEAAVNLAGVDWAARRLRVNVSVTDAEVALRLKDLIGTNGGSGGAGGGWRVLVNRVEVKNTRLTLDGSGVNVPDARLDLSPGPDGRVNFSGHTADGKLRGDVRVTEQRGENVYAVNFAADARILRPYWQGVEAGKLQGRYVFFPHTVQGDVKLVGGLLRVPNAEFVEVRQVSGRAAHRGDDVTLNLAGRAWNGPVTAQGAVDLKAEHWTVTVDADPTVAGLARSLNTTGQGDLKLRVTAGGWSTVRVKGYVKGGDGPDGAVLGGVPLRRLRAEYTLLNRDGDTTPQTNDVAFSAYTKLAGEQQLRGQWAIGRAGTVGWKGDLAGKPLDVAARIGAEGALTLTGQALGGPMKGRYAMQGGDLQAVLNPDYGAARARVALSGRPEDLRADISGGQVGPLNVTGTARLTPAGLQADLNTADPAHRTGPAGRVILDLDPQFRGEWTAQNVQASGVELNGSGALDAQSSTLAGDLAAQAPGLDAPLRGRLTLNGNRQTARFAFGQGNGPQTQRLTWDGGNVGASLDRLSVLGGVRVSGDVQATPPGAGQDWRATGQLSAQGQGYDLWADLRGNVASLRGSAGGVTVLADSDLGAPYRTTARLSGSDIGGVFSLAAGENPGVRFTLNTRGESASGVLSGQNLDATGRIDLAALRPLLPQGQRDLSGTLDLNLRGLGGTAKLNGQLSGVALRGLLTRRPGTAPGGEVQADLQAALPLNGEDVTARLTGQVYPRVQVSGAARYLGQTLQAAVQGPYERLTASLRGRTGELSFGGVTLPAQTLDLSGTLTPALQVGGRWGDLQAAYDGESGLLRLSGAQSLTAFGQTGRVQGRATWGPPVGGAASSSFRGAVQASGTLDQYTLSLSGPWNTLDVLVRGPEGLQARGTASLPAGRYDLDVSGPLAIPGQGNVLVDGNIQGTGAHPRGLLSVTDAQGGQGRLRLDGFDDLDLELGGLTLAGQRLTGQLRARGGQLTGQLRAGAFDLRAEGGRVRASGAVAGQRVELTGRLLLPATLSDLRLVSDGPYFTARASGDPDDLRGTLTLRQQQFGNDAARLVVPAQSFPLRASLTGARANLGGLIYQGGRWAGGLNAAYALWTGDLKRSGQVRLAGGGDVLAALPSGPLSGRVQLLPALGGELSTPLSPLLAGLPAEIRAAISPGVVTAQFGAAQGRVRLGGTRYQGQPLDFTAQADWRNGLRVTGLLAHPRLFVPLRYGPDGLSVQNARLNARLLAPVLPGAAGEVGLNLNVPGLDWQRATGLARLNVQAQGQPLTGTLALRDGALDGDLRAGPLTLTARRGALALSGKVADHALRASGRLTLPGTLSDLRVDVAGPYLRASAAGGLSDLRGTLTLREQQFGGGAAQLVFPVQSFPLRASATAGRVQVSGLSYAGGRWSGGLNAAYTLWTGDLKRAGRLRLAGGGKVLAAFPSGPLSGRVGLLPSVGGEVSTSLAPFVGTLPPEVRASLQPGRLWAKVSASGAEVRLQNTRYQGEALGLNAAVSWLGGVRAAGRLTHPGTLLPFEYSESGLRVSGGVLSARVLRPVLPDAAGRLRLDLNVPDLDWARATGQAHLDLSAGGQQARGAVTLRAGQLAADLASTLGGQTVTVRGPLYPQADAALTVGGVRGTLTGSAERELTLRARGKWEERDLDLVLRGTGLTGAAARADLNATVSGATLTASAQRGTGAGLSAWKVGGHLLAPDLTTLGGPAGQLSAALSGTLNDLRLNAAGQAAGVTFTAPLRYAGGELRVSGLQAHLPSQTADGPGLGEVTANGTLWPRLALTGRARLNEGAPGDYTAQVTGSLSRPDLRVQGRLNEGLAGLDAAGTRLEGRLLGQDWKLDLSGERLSGGLRGRLNSGPVAGLTTARLTLNARYRSGTGDSETGNSGIDVGLRGPLGWNARQGWSGSVRATGDVPGGPLDAVLDGRGALNLAGSLGLGERQATFTGQLPAGLPLRPGGELTLQRVDLGAFWNRAGQLRASGQATLGGSSWDKLTAAFSGQLDDAAGELSGAVQATYRAGDAEVSLRGAGLQGDATLRAGRYAATLKASRVQAARLLPGTLNLPELTFAGAFDLSGTLAHGPERLRLQRAALRGLHREAGPFSLYGDAEYDPRLERLSADLRGSLRGGQVRAQGTLPQGLQVNVRDVAAAYPGAASFGQVGQGGQGKLGADLNLTGALRDPHLTGKVTGAVQTEQGLFDLLLTVGGQMRRLDLHARVQASGQARGTLYAEARQLDATGPQNGRVRVYGTLDSAQARVRADLQGVWPRLTGDLSATVPGLPTPVTLRGDGAGGYDVAAGTLGSGQITLTPGEGAIPGLTGRLDLKPLALVQGAQGQANVQADLGGTLAAPTLAATLDTAGVQVGGAGLPDLRGSLTGRLNDLSTLSGSFVQNGAEGPVASLKGPTLSLLGLRLEGAGATVTLRGQASPGAANVTAQAAGTVAGEVGASYDRGSLSVNGQVSSQGVQAALDVRANTYTGWAGGVRVTGGPQGVLTEPLALKLGGAYAHPLLTGEGGLLGARARVVAGSRGVQVRLVDGPDATANGLVELRPDERGEWQWHGAASLSRPELAFSVTPSGPPADPDLLLTLRRGEWRASGSAGLTQADLRLSDGTREGSLTWKNEQLRADLPGLDLSRLGVRGLSGSLFASGQVSSRTQSGAVQFRVTGLTSPQTIPVLGLAPSGDIGGTVTLTGGRPSVQARADLNAGTLDLSAVQVPGQGGVQPHWEGQLGGTLRRGTGQIVLDLRAAAGSLSGGAEVKGYPLDLAGQGVTADGQLKLSGRTFSAALTARNGLGSARLTAEGGVADALPALGSLLAVAPTGDGYDARATLDAVDLAALKLAPGLAGQVYGAASLSDGGSTFFLASDGVQLGEKKLPLRIEGTQVASSWRLRGFLDRSDFTAGLSGGEVFGQGTLQALPLGAVVAAFTGTTPGEGVVTGVARFRFPLSDPLAGRASVVAERIRVSAKRQENGQTVTETLTGTGSLDYAERELRNINVQLGGAGTWDVRGQYTRQKVDVNARFTDATFTPVLRLVPGLADLNPALQGTILLSAAGTYDRPRGLLRAENLVGEVGGLTVRVPNFAGDLPDSGAFTAGGRIQTGGTLGADGQVDVRGQLTLGKLSDTVATFSGLFAPEALGPLPNTILTLRQQGDTGWRLEARSRSVNPVSGAGTLTLEGDLVPRWNLTLRASNYNLPIAAIYARESALTGEFRVVDGGDFVRVSGEGDFARLTLGRVDAPDTLPAAPGKTTPGQSGDTFVSPLPEQYTTFAKPAATGGAAGTPPATPAQPLLERILLDDLRLRASGGIRLDETLARAEFSTPGLTVSGTAARPRIRGEIVAQRGSIFLRENEFVITQSNVTFSGDGLYPSFSLVARGTVPSASTRQQVPILLSVRGNFRTTDGLQGVLDLDTQLSCADTGEQCLNPQTRNAYTQEELYALVATGVPDLNNLSGNLAALGTSAVQTALNVFFLGELERTLARGLGVDVLRLTPALGLDGSVNATLTVGSYLTRDLFVQYQVDLRGAGLINATYSTPDGRFTFNVSTPLNGLDLQSVRPNFKVAYNVNPRLSFSVGVETKAEQAASAGVAARPESTELRFGVTYRIGGR